MKNTKKLTALVGTLTLVGALSVTAFAATQYATPAEVVAGLTGRTTASVVAERRESSKSYGAMAAAAGKLAEFKAEVLEMKKQILAERVQDGVMTQDQADALQAALVERQIDCDGTGGEGHLGLGVGERFGQGAKVGYGARRGGGRGMGVRGMGYGNGVCITP